MNSISIMRSDKGFTVIIITDAPEPSVQHFPTFQEVKDFIQTLNA